MSKANSWEERVNSKRVIFWFVGASFVYRRPGYLYHYLFIGAILTLQV